MTALAIVPVAPAPVPWKAQPGESVGEHLAFLHWALQDGPLRDELATRYAWAQRRTALDSLEVLGDLSPADMVSESAIAQVRIAFSEVLKLQRNSLENPDSVMSPREVLESVKWMLTEAKDFASRRADALDWTSLTPEEREIMIQAKEIQDRLLKGASV